MRDYRMGEAYDLTRSVSGIQRIDSGDEGYLYQNKAFFLLRNMAHIQH